MQCERLRPGRFLLSLLRRCMWQRWIQWHHCIQRDLANPTTEVFGPSDSDERHDIDRCLEADMSKSQSGGELPGGATEETTVQDGQVGEKSEDVPQNIFRKG